MNQKLSIVTLFLHLLGIVQTVNAQDPLFPNSVVSNDIDFILSSDPDAFETLTYLGQEDKEMPDSQSEELFDQNTYIFEASFSTGETVEIWCHSSFGSVKAAQEYAEKACPRLGKLPIFQRDGLDHIVIHNGDATAFAEVGFFMLYSQNMDDRISTNDLEETVFHESIHSTFQVVHGEDAEWLAAQESDPTFVTDYAQNFPALEDMPETALFAYAYHSYPGRLDAEIETWLEENIPARLAYFGAFYSQATMSVITSSGLPTMQVFPNPSHGEITLLLNSVETGSQIALYDLYGNRVKTQIVMEKEDKISLDALAAGVYILFLPGYQTLRLVKQ